VPTFPQGFEFECPLCRAATFSRAPQVAGAAPDPALYKCGGCHFHFSDPTRYPKALGSHSELRAAGRTPTE
jgi:transposase-like protein